MEKKLLIPISNKREGLRAALRRMFLIEKLSNPVGIAILLFVSVMIGYAVSKFGLTAGVLTVAAMVALPTVYCIVAFPRFGIIVFLSLAYFIMFFLKIGVNFPLGTLMDGMEGLFILSLFINQKKNKDWSMFKGPISIMILTWIGYNLAEVLNLDTESREAWIYTVRSVAVVMFMYFIFVYYIDTVQFIRFIFKLWIAFALFAALYAFKQEHIGFFGFEDAYLHSDPAIAGLLYIGGVWRKFSIFSDPVAFSYNMVSASLLCIGLLTGPLAKLKKAGLAVIIMFYLVAMLYSGTRGAYVLIPATMAILVILKYNKKVLLIVAVAAILVTGLIFMPTGNQTLYRFQTAFKPSEDASFNLRKMNQKRIQPYIASHPFGGGLGATGEWGERFAPNSYLAHFPPDSGYVRVAVELGWVGLFLFCLLIFVILCVGINNYFKIRDPELKSYCLAMVLIVFALNIGNYPQEALVQFPTNVYFYLVVALINVTLRLDQQKTKALDAVS